MKRRVRLGRKERKDFFPPNAAFSCGVARDEVV
jgi:hypothetical protein